MAGLTRAGAVLKLLTGLSKRKTAIVSIKSGKPKAESRKQTQEADFFGFSLSDFCSKKTSGVSIVDVLKSGDIFLRGSSR
ncbi:MAG: hypothetical protein IID45_07785 [Planctomycetes bacterium]|nr:hypothetical protein [Planctomycetota bacterium]